ncbi:hypothetical protein HWB52_gp10 [Pseudomonas phage Littlefix]|uniref:Uncharacterized protein n=1 Tax=Pseudomonas phage Littlefix TaxID=2079289 RepID=A0A2K9VHV0_9CAUD|nr:hypothetical protein HWB52_gp10 [Pseudomonas phage Littlefix]AUV61825.1 hypothetical protein PsPhLittlefix_gp10 [Pseudomonas phage Littlefix]
MLPGDEFSLPDWAQAQSRKKNALTIPVEVQEAIDNLLSVCETHGVPVLTAVEGCQGVAMDSSLGVDPSIVSAEMLMSRAMLSNNPEHVMHVAMAQMQGMKP